MPSVSVEDPTLLLSEVDLLTVDSGSMSSSGVDLTTASRQCRNFR